MFDCEHSGKPQPRFHPPFPPPWGANLGPLGGNPRARRGDVQTAILGLIAEKPMHGYQILQELAERSGGVWKPSPGSVYPTLQLLEDQGLLTSEQAGGKRVFSLTDEGRAKVAEQSGEAPWDEFASEIERLSPSREAITGLMVATSQVLHAGSPEQVRKMVEVLGETRKSIYRILAEDE
ncbi:MAG: PadR family transcriptional regulator [Coriobacteriia bacterium]|nr:PadR family transcriptional regulator [Coriobacteriia bacterium]